MMLTGEAAREEIAKLRGRIAGLPVPDAWRPGPDFDAPAVTDLCAVTSYFNPCRYATRRRHYDTFAEAMASEGVPLFTVEVATGDDEWQLSGDNVLRLRSRSVLWHKERALNVLVATLPARFTKVAWVDCDFLWLRRGWHREASRRLDTWPVVQLFREMIWETREGLPGLTRPSFVARNPTPGTYIGCCPGGAWAARRELWTRLGGLYDRFIIGGADELAAAAFNRAFDVCPVLPAINDVVRADYLAWAVPVSEWVAGRMTLLDVTVRHLWHGDKSHRQYQDRMKAMLDFNPHKDIRANVDGLWEWSSAKPETHEGFVEFFRKRREDG
jgi:hypothetical protein